ncbi:toxin regulator, partial [Clostridioides difficile]
RVLEDDYITIRGISAGTITYESTMGGKITIPGIAVEKIN